MLSNAYFLAKIGADTAENEQNFAKNLPALRAKGLHHQTLNTEAGLP